MISPIGLTDDMKWQELMKGAIYMDEKIKYWIDIAKYDIESAKVMFDGNRYLYVGFMCHQSIEKMLKAMYVKELKETPPYIHI